MGDLEEVDPRQPAGEQDRVDLLLDVARRAGTARPPASPSRRRTLLSRCRCRAARPARVPRSGHRTGARASSTRSRSPVDEPSGRDARLRERRRPRRVARAGPAHPGLEHPPHAVAARGAARAPRRGPRAGGVRITSVDPPIPGREALVERHEQPIRVGPAVDEQAAAARALDEDRVALADVEDRDPRRGRRAGGRRRGRRRRRDAPARPATIQAARRAGVAVGRRSLGWARAAAPSAAAEGPRTRSPGAVVPATSTSRRDASTRGQTSSGGSSVTLANGRAGGDPDDRRRRREQRPRPGSRQDGADAGRHARRATSARRRPARARRRPSPAATSGTTARLTTGARSDSRPNDARTTGSVAACAASETPRLSASQPGRRPPADRSIQPVIGVAQAISPPVASDESWNPASPIERRDRPGAAGSRPSRAPPPRDPPGRTRGRAARPRPSRPPGATDGDAPANDDVGARSRRSSATDRRRRPSRPATAAIERRDDRDVPAGDRHDVAHAGRREVGRELSVDPVAQADQDARREPGLRLGEHASASASPRRGAGLEPPVRGRPASDDLERFAP